jgi:hypothetical protein
LRLEARMAWRTQCQLIFHREELPLLHSRAAY